MPADVGIQIDPPIDQRTHQVDAPARTIHLGAQFDIGRACGRAQTTVDAIEEEFVVDPRGLCHRQGSSLGRGHHTTMLRQFVSQGADNAIIAILPTFCFIAIRGLLPLRAGWESACWSGLQGFWSSRSRIGGRSWRAGNCCPSAFPRDILPSSWSRR